MAEKILIVDDEQEIADLVELYLKNENYTVYQCHTAQEALRCIEETELDLAILDIMLPGTSGLALCQKIRERHTILRLLPFLRLSTARQRAAPM